MERDPQVVNVREESALAERLAALREQGLRQATECRATLIFEAALRLKQATPTQSIEDCVAEAERVWEWLLSRTRAALSTRGSWQ